MRVAACWRAIQFGRRRKEHIELRDPDSAQSALRIAKQRQVEFAGDDLAQCFNRLLAGEDVEEVFREFIVPAQRDRT
jgi:hypothetical protein